MIEAGANPLIIDYNGRNALFNVAQSKVDRYEKFEILLDLGLNPNQRTDTGAYVLGGLLTQKDVDLEVIRLFMDHGADLSLELQNGLTILETVRRCAEPKVKEMVNICLKKRQREEEG